MGCSPSAVKLDFESRPAYEEVRYLERERRNLDKYFHRLSDKLRHRNTSDETIHVRDVVENCIRAILESVAIISKSFCWKKDPMLKVGSFYEGSAISGSSRFDYIALLDEFTPENVSLDVGNKHLGSLPVNILLNDSSDKLFTRKWKTNLKGSKFKGCRSGEQNKPGLLDKFAKCVRKVCTLFTPRLTKFGTISIVKENPITQRESLVLLKFLLTKTIEEQRGSKLVRETSTQIIYVTITPAIKWGDAVDYIYPQDVHIPRLYDAIVKHGMFLVVPSIDGYFKVAFTDTESSLLCNMSQRHKRALSVVKFLIKGDMSFFDCKEVSKYSIFDSYSIKMIALALEETCPCTSGQLDYDLYECVMHILKVIQAGLHNHDASYSDTWDLNYDAEMLSEMSDAKSDVDLIETDITDTEQTTNGEKSENDIGKVDDIQDESGSNITDNESIVNENNPAKSDQLETLESNSDIEENNTNDDVQPTMHDDKLENNDIEEISVTRHKTIDHVEERGDTTPDEVDLPLEYDILRLLSPRMRVRVNETSLYVNCANFHELMKHDLKFWIGQRERYDFWSATPSYGVTCLAEKLKKNAV